MQDQKNSIAIIGMSLLLPDAANQEEFYHNLRDAKDSLTGPSLERLIYASLAPGKAFMPGAYVGRIDQFDHKFFKISKKEAEFMDPAQRILLELTCASIENAGYAIDDFRNTETAVYLCSNTMFSMVYQMKIEAVYDKPDPAIHTGTLNSMIAGRISYCLGLTGPSLMIDCGCSSSVVALNEAVDKLIAGSINTAVVGGLVLKPSAQQVGKEGHLGAASRSGKSRAFDAEADGIGLGEGGGIILIKRLEDAIRDNDNIQAVIRGIGITQDGGRCNSIAAPSPIAQTSAIKKAWARSNADPRTISYIETHGAGTHLGDVIEIQALTDAFGPENAGEKICALGAVKTNIGHIGNAAGIAGLIKAVISLKKKELFPCLHFKTPNPFIDFENAPVYVNTEHKQWDTPAGLPRRCGVSSFGLSGTNGHVVLEEFIKPAANVKTQGAANAGLFLKIAAKTGTAWENYRKQITEFISQAPYSTEDILYTLNTGRTDYKCRMGFYAESREQLVRQLMDCTKAPEPIPVKDEAKPVVLLFSSGAYSPVIFQKLYTTSSYFRLTYDGIIRDYGTPAAGSLTETFAIQLALYQQVFQSGIPVKTVIGNGIGSLVTQVISGNLTIPAALALIEQQQVPSSPVDETKLKKLVSNFIDSNCKTFAELGADNIFFDKLSAWSSAPAGLELIPRPDEKYSDPVLAMFTALYNLGISADWKKYYGNKNYSRIEAPTYPFERIRCWYEDAIDPAAEAVRHSLYEQGWQINAEECATAAITDQTFLIFTANRELAAKLIDQLRLHDNRCIEVLLSDRFKRHSEGYYEIDSSNEDDYALLREMLAGDKFDLTGLIHLGTYVQRCPLSVNNHTQLLEKSFAAQYLSAKVFADNFSKRSFYYAALTSDAYRIADTDTYIAPLHAMTAVLAKSLMAEYPSLNISCLDLTYNEYTLAEVTALLLREMSHDNLLRFAAIRKGEKYTPALVSVQAESVDPSTGFLAENGVYIVTGGASGIGLETCKAIAGEGPAHFIIIGRTILPPVEQWDKIIADGKSNASYERILALHTLRQLGAVVEYHAADAGDATAMQVVLQHVSTQFAKITGIIHAAGLGNSGTSIKQRAVADMKATLSPKITGTLVLEEFTRNLQPDFFLSFSSIAVLVPSKNSADYSSANSFEDAFAHQMRIAGKRFIVINWSDWKETGLAYRKRLLRSEETVEAREKVVKGLSNKEGILAIRYAMALDKPQIAVANVDMASFSVNPFFSVNTTIGKVNPEVAASQPVPEKKTMPMQSRGDLSEVEYKLAVIWHEVLKLDTVQPDDDFYELGGHSLNITQMLNKIKKVFGVTLEMDEMFYNNTVRLLAARIEEYIAQGNQDIYEKIEPLGDLPYYDISHAQKRFWIVNQQTGREAYNVPAAYVFTGSLNIKALEKAFQVLVERHESLRTSFLLVEGIPKQQIHPMGSFDLSLPCNGIQWMAGKPEEVKQLLQREAAVPFNLEEAPLIRIKLFQLEENKYVFFMNMHHIVADATSISVIRNEVLMIYKAIAEAQEIKLEKLTIQYKDFAAWQNQQLTGGKLKKYKDYWHNRLSEATPVIELPVDYQPADKKNGQSGKIRIVIENNQFAAFKKHAEKNNTSLFTLSLALFNVLLYKYTGDNDLVLGTPVNGREHNELDKQVGIYLNTLLLRTKIDENLSFSELLQQVKENTFKDLAHQLYPYDLLSEDLKLGQFNTGFTWTVRELAGEGMELDFQIEEMPTGFGVAKNDLWLFGVECKDRLILEFMYKTVLFKEETIALMAERLHAIVAQVIENSSRKINELHIKTALELKMEQEMEVFEFDF
jgi:acyl transferase domain-containing protein/NAD(P)-dependent dehydrogenase (short-subunit alcohol dehydrogenase family)/acyl carrier protein